ncbi:hypothetical protein [Corynebacterium oculi]|uniref:Uncharacterized protein n=1 Tax=Corynebacterium oculi TaxID=1544416 RepID=A0A0Q0TWU9_9CORY|nr:hypothetical protein [Corynebacterium oculi]KQB83385.1 hypothetical protein Cocul_02360 [Corynebacterium oculi]
MRAVRWNKETARDGSIILSCLCGIALGGTVAGAVNNVYVAHRFAENLDGEGGVEVAAKVERAWEFIQMAGYSAVGVVVFAVLAVVLSRGLRM